MNIGFSYIKMHTSDKENISTTKTKFPLKRINLPTFDFFHPSFSFFFKFTLLFIFLFASLFQFFLVEQKSELSNPFLYITNISKLNQPFPL